MMDRFLVFNTEAEARRRNREMMDVKRKPDNSDGDGKPYTTIERHALRVAQDGTAALVIGRDDDLLDHERSGLLDECPEKFKLPSGGLDGIT